MPKIEYKSYSFEFIGGINNVYSFQTDVGHIYLVTFKPTPYLFEFNPEFADDTFEFSIVLAGKSTGKIVAQDVMTSITIAEIVNDFYSN